jgi:hypothetical protein
LQAVEVWKRHAASETRAYFLDDTSRHRNFAVEVRQELQDAELKEVLQERKCRR